jgi:outer membrane protein OmpA-like peptidoglycan-associated protein
MRKVNLLLAVGIVMMVAGCGKKEAEKVEPKTLAHVEDVALLDDKAEGMEVAIQDEIPTYEYDEERFIDADSISEFAFVDEGTSDESAQVAMGDVPSAVEDALSSDDEPIDWGEKEGAEFEFEVVNYDINENEIRADQAIKVKKNVEMAKTAVKEGKSIVIAGHSDQLGPQAYNLALSERRAKVIKDEMVDQGVPSDSIKIVGCGNEMPVVWSDNSDRSEMIKELEPNRRSEVITS